MIKKLIMATLLLMTGVTMISAAEMGSSVTLEVKRIKDSPLNPAGGKSPIEIPYVWQEDNLLLLCETHPEYVLNLVDDTNTVVYTTIVPANVSVVQLPTTLSGTYELQLILDDLCFYGDIEL